MKHVNWLPPGRRRWGLCQALYRQGRRREVAVSVTHFLAAPEVVAVTDYCTTLPGLICRRLAHDPRLKVLPAPVDLGTFPVEMAWHVRYRHDTAHRWLRGLISEVAKADATARSRRLRRRLRLDRSAERPVGKEGVSQSRYWWTPVL